MTSTSALCAAEVLPPPPDVHGLTGRGLPPGL